MSAEFAGFDWLRCDHEGIGLPGCTTCDPLPAHWKIRARFLEATLNTPEVLDFAKAVNLEAAHQRSRWGTDQDAGKTDADWFWLIGFLVGKALHKPEKRLHHLITAAAALANWHLYSLGKSNMRPGIEPPKGPHDRDDCPCGHPLGTDGPCAGCNCADPDPTLPAEGGGGS